MIYDPLTSYKAVLKACNYASTTQRAYFKAFRAFYVANNLKVDQMTTIEINSYLASLGTPSAITTAGAALKLYFSHCVNREIKVIKPIRTEAEPIEVLTENEVCKLLESCKSAKIKLLFSTVYYLGLRRREVLNLTVKDIMADGLIIRDERNGSRILKPPVFLSVGISEYIAKEGIEGNLFCLTNTELKTQFNKALLAAGISKAATLHSLRHSCATHLFNKGANLLSIKKYLGHKSLNTTLIYIQSGAETIQLSELKNDFNQQEATK